MNSRAATTVELAGALASGRNVLLTGPAGVGKTWLAKAAVTGAEQAGRSARTIFGTTSARDVPLAALSSLIPGTVASAENGLLLARAREALVATLSAGDVSLLLIDDADLLDGMSAVILRQLVDTQRLQVVLVARSAASLAPALRNSDDSTFVALELGPLDGAGTTTLVEEKLGGQVSARAATRLHRLSRGSPLVILELVRVALASGSLRQHRAVWQLDGPLPADARLAELVSLRLGALDRPSREALELIAIGEPLDLDIVVSFATAPVVELLEETALIEIASAGGRPLVNLAHPLYGEWLQSAMPISRRRRLCAALVTTLEPTSGDAVQLALLRVEAGIATDPGVLLAAGTMATRHDARLAHRLLRAAVAAGGGLGAQLALAESIALSQPVETGALLAELSAGPLPDDARMAVVALSALVTTLAGDDPSELWSVVGDVALAPPPIQLAAAAAYLLSGNAARAVELAAPLADDVRLPSQARWRAALWAVAGMATTGQLDGAIALCDRTFAALGDQPDAGGFDIAALQSAVILAHERRGDLPRASEIARTELDRPGGEADDRARPRMLQCLARVAMLRGEPTVAARHMREVLADLGGADEVFAPWNLSLLAVADAMRGRPDLALKSLAEMDAAAHDLAVYRPEQQLSRSQVLACAGDLAGARAAALEAATQAVAVGHFPVALLAWNAVARYGDARTARDGAQFAAKGVDGPFAQALCQQVEALADGDAAALCSLGDFFAGLGFRPSAAEAYAGAVAAAGRHGDARDEARATERLRAVLGAGEPLCIPAAALPTAARALTVRERDVAALAGAGVSDRVIAQRLGVSIRTVQTHLAHVYAKTHTSGRRELADLLQLPTYPGTDAQLSGGS